MLLPVFLKSTENAENRNILTTLDRLLTVFTCHQRNPNSDQEKQRADQALENLL